MKSLGEKIAQIRKDLRETQEEFARRFDKATSTIGGWEANIKVPRHKDLLKIAQIGNTKVEVLLGVSEKDTVVYKGKELDQESQRVVADLTKRILEADGEEKRLLLNMLKGLINYQEAENDEK